MSASRNAGVRAGTGDYISFLDADDIWLPGRLEHFVGIAERFPDAGMIYGPTLYWYSWAEERGLPPVVPGQDDFPGLLEMPINRLVPPPEALRRFLLTHGGCLPGICSLLIRRDAYEALGGFEEEFRGLYEDQVFLSKMTLSYPVVVIDEVLDRYRQHSESCCFKSMISGEYHPDDEHPARQRYLQWLWDYCAATGRTDIVIQRELHRQLRPYAWPRLYRRIRQLQRLAWRARRKYRHIRSRIGKDGGRATS